jgi:hypothetical protein
MQPVDTLLAQDAHGLDADAKVLADPLTIEGIRHAGELELAVERLVGNAEQRSVGDAEA